MTQPFYDIAREPGRLRRHDEPRKALPACGGFVGAERGADGGGGMLVGVGMLLEEEVDGPSAAVNRARRSAASDEGGSGR